MKFLIAILRNGKVQITTVDVLPEKCLVLLVMKVKV